MGGVGHVVLVVIERPEVSGDGGSLGSVEVLRQCTGSSYSDCSGSIGPGNDGGNRLRWWLVVRLPLEVNLSLEAGVNGWTARVGRWRGFYGGFDFRWRLK